MPPPMMRSSTLFDEIFEQLELGRHFGAADDRRNRALRIAERGSSASSSACIARPA